MAFSMLMEQKPFFPAIPVMTYFGLRQVLSTNQGAGILRLVGIADVNRDALLAYREKWRPHESTLAPM